MARKHHIFFYLLFSVLLFIFYTTFFPPIFSSWKVSAEPSFSEITSEAAVLMEFSTGEIVFARNEEEALPPASLTKIMTLFVVYEAIEKGQLQWEDEVTVSKKAWQTGGSQMFLELGQEVSVKELVNGISTISANDACIAIAEHLYGSEELFVREMNKLAQELGLVQTRFQNSSGLHHPEHFSSAVDMARLARTYLSKFPQALELHSQKEYSFNNILQHNRNPLLQSYPGADGLKTGHTQPAGFCLIGTAKQDNMRFITVILNAKNHGQRLKDSENLLNYAFRHFVRHTVFHAGEVVAAIEVTGGEERFIDVIVEHEMSVVIPFQKQDELNVQFKLPEQVQAKVEKGAELGSALLFLEDKMLLEVPLVAAGEVHKAGTITLIKRSLLDLLISLWQNLLHFLEKTLPWP